MEVAEHIKQPEVVFRDYADAHMARTLFPVAVMGGRATIHSLRPSKLVRALPLVLDLRGYYAREAAADTYAKRKARIEQALSEILQTLGNDTTSTRKRLVEQFAQLLAQGGVTRGVTSDAHWLTNGGTRVGVTGIGPRLSMTARIACHCRVDRARKRNP